jgi:2-amino-4-hydroxy-6-hydroxymethyldihydropteridine diphosphokinase
MTQLWTPAYIAVGANLDDPLARVQESFECLANIRATKLMARSRLFRTAPLGPRDQPDFINAVVGVVTQLTPADLLFELKALEKALGRQTPVVTWGPRHIDFDLLVFGSQRFESETLTLPHPGVPVRNFVLYPLLDIAPELIVPGHGRVHELAKRVCADGISVLASTN